MKGILLFPRADNHSGFVSVYVYFAIVGITDFDLMIRSIENNSKQQTLMELLTSVCLTKLLEAVSKDRNVNKLVLKDLVSHILKTKQ